MSTQPAPPLSAIKVGSFCYHTVKNRWPTIISKIVNTVCNVKKAYENDTIALEDLKIVAGQLSELKYRIQTDKPVLPLPSTAKDAERWNAEIVRLGGETCKWFSSPWLFLECYLYRRVRVMFELSSRLQDFDPFREQKETSLKEHWVSVIAQVNHMIEGFKDTKIQTVFLKEMIYSCLWGNQYDLSLSGGEQKSAKSNNDVRHFLEEQKTFLLVDNSQDLVDRLLNLGSDAKVHIVLDNAGVELLGDMCLAETLLHYNCCSQVVFHAKEMPWFVSDVTDYDFHWLLDQLVNYEHSDVLQKYGKIWSERLKADTFILKIHPFWTWYDDYAQMNIAAPELYNEIRTGIVIFKGDLNYRKLVSDRNWPLGETSFKTALRGFNPSFLCALRALKAETVAGLDSTTVQRLNEKHPNLAWMSSGEYAVIQTYAAT